MVGSRENLSTRQQDLHFFEGGLEPTCPLLEQRDYVKLSFRPSISASCSAAAYSSHGMRSIETIQTHFTIDFGTLVRTTIAAVIAFDDLTVRQIQKPNTHCIPNVSCSINTKERHLICWTQCAFGYAAVLQVAHVHTVPRSQPRGR